MTVAQESSTPVTRALLEEFVRALLAEEIYDEVTGVAVFADGSPCAVCTNAARRTADTFGGVVMGYWAAGNPTAQTGERYGDGHDFAVVADRWVVDYFALTTVDLLESAVLDLRDPVDRRLVSQLLGDRATWEVGT